MFDAKDEKEYYVEVKFIKYGTYTFHATSKEHAMEMYDRGEWSDYDEEYDCYDEQVVEVKEEELTEPMQLSLSGVLCLIIVNSKIFYGILN